MSGSVSRPDRNDSDPASVFSFVTPHPSDNDLRAAPTEPTPNTPEVIERPDRHRFELFIDGELVSFADYALRPDVNILVPHVETRVEHRGNGHAAQLMEGMLGLLRSSGRKIQPVCPFAAAHVRSDVSHHDLLAG